MATTIDSDQNTIFEIQLFQSSFEEMFAVDAYIIHKLCDCVILLVTIVSRNIFSVF